MAVLEEEGSGRGGWPELCFARCFDMFRVAKIKKDLFDIVPAFAFVNFLPCVWL